MRTVKNELHRYKDDGVLPEDALLDLISQWDSYEQSCPLLYKVALDVLPVQASAVSCEHIYSSSKETCDLRRSLLSASMFEVLQVLKHLYKQDRLDFASVIHTAPDAQPANLFHGNFVLHSAVLLCFIAVTKAVLSVLEKNDIPGAVAGLVTGGKDVGEALVQSPDIAGGELVL